MTKRGIDPHRGCRFPAESDPPDSARERGGIAGLDAHALHFEPRPVRALHHNSTVMGARRWKTIACGAVTGLLLATCAAAVPLPEPDAERLRPPLREGDSFHAARPGQTSTFAFVYDRAIVETPATPTRLPALLRRGQTESVAAPVGAGLSLSMGAALIGILGLAVHGSPRRCPRVPSGTGALQREARVATLQLTALR